MNSSTSACDAEKTARGKSAIKTTIRRVRHSRVVRRRKIEHKMKSFLQRIQACRPYKTLLKCLGSHSVVQTSTNEEAQRSSTTDRASILSESRRSEVIGCADTWHSCCRSGSGSRTPEIGAFSIASTAGEKTVEPVHPSFDYNNVTRRKAYSLPTCVSSISDTPHAMQGLQPPIALCCLKIFQYRMADQLNSALTLNTPLVLQLNLVFQYEHKIAICLAHIESIDEDLAKINSMASELKKHLERDSGDQKDNLDSMKRAEVLFEQYTQERSEVEVQLQHWHSKLLEPKTEMFVALKGVMAANNLLEPITDSIYEDKDEISVAQASSIEARAVPFKEDTSPKYTPSEAERQMKTMEQKIAMEKVRAAQDGLFMARLELDNWHYTCYEMYRDWEHYCEVKDAEQPEISRSEIDVELFQKAQATTRAVIGAEDRLDAARERRRQLGLVDSEQESGFPDCTDDGYRESLEAAILATVDRGRIERWMDSIDTADEDKESSPIEFDDWEAKSLGLGDSGSVVAEGKERKRIDRWQKMCESWRRPDSQTNL